MLLLLPLGCIPEKIPEVYDRGLDADEIAEHYAWGLARHAFCD